MSMSVRLVGEPGFIRSPSLSQPVQENRDHAIGKAVALVVS
jgi:hypothetical protein